MRIISGSLKGRKLNSWKTKLPVRPMTDRIKEALFNVLAPCFSEDCFFLDLFSGTGNLAIEALSRGAKQSYAVEKHPLCIELIKQNSKILPNPKKLIIHKKNVFPFLKQAEKSNTLNKPRASQNYFDIIVADPPFSIKAGAKIMESLQNSFLTKKETIIVIETGQKENLKNNYQNFHLFSKKTFSDKQVWFYEFR